MRIALGADHAGFDLKEGLRELLAEQGHEVLDLGTFDPSQPDDYPDYAVSVGRVLQQGQAERGILLCGSGLGVSVAANKIPGIRAGLPGMKVLQFAFDGNPVNPFLPHTYGPDSVVSTGTHDNDTTRGWYATLPEGQRRAAWSYLGQSPGAAEVAWELLRRAWSSAAAPAMAPLQDVLNLGSEARMNRPGSPEGNRRCRASGEMLTAPNLDRLRDLAGRSGRVPATNAAPTAAVLRRDLPADPIGDTVPGDLP